MALEWAIDVELIRDALGMMAAIVDESRLTSPVIVRPVVSSVLELCPSIEEVEDEASREVIQIGVASMIASELMRSMPMIETSRLGDSTFTLMEGDTEVRARRLWQTGLELVGDMCPVKVVDRRAAIFRVMPSGRGR